MKHYPLSYPINTVNWDGKFVSRLPDEKFLPVCRTLKELGVRELMVSGYVTVEEADFDMEEETKRLGGLLNSMGMRPAQHHGHSASYAPPEDPQEPVIERLIRSVRYTANMNSPFLVIHPGLYHKPESWKQHVMPIPFFESQCEKHGVEKILGIAAANLHEAGREAEKLGVKIALENVDRFEPFGGADLLPELIRKADSPAVGFCLDSGHAHCCGVTSPTEWIHLMKGKLFTTHFHDNRGPRLQALTDKKWIKPKTIDEHLPPGFGTIPWIDVIHALWDTGYDNTVNFESGGWTGMDGKEGFEAAIRFWRTCELLADQKRSK